MQKAFGWTERVLVCMALLGLVLLLAWDTGAEQVLLIVSLGLLAILYFVAGYFQPSRPGQKPAVKYTLVKMLSGLALANLVVGVLFKLLFWRGEENMLVVGSLSTIAAALAARRLTGPGHDLSGVFRRVALWSMVGGLLFFTNSVMLFGLFYRNNPVLVEKYTAMQAHPGDPRYQADYVAYRRQHYLPQTKQ